MARQTKSKPDESPFQREDDFESLYANNVHFESSLWDLKMVFGELDQSHEPAKIEQHTAITIPWRMAKLMAYLLEVNVAIYESQNGPIVIPSSVIPQEPDPSAPDVAGNPIAISYINYLRSRYKWFFGDQAAARTEEATFKKPK